MLKFFLFFTFNTDNNIDHTNDSNTDAEAVSWSVSYIVIEIND